MSKKTPQKKGSKQELAKLDHEKRDPIKFVATKDDKEVKQSDIHKFIEALRSKSPEFDNDFLALKQKYHECFDKEIGLHVQILEGRRINEEVKDYRMQVADRLHPVILAVKEEIPEISRHKMAMILSHALRDVDAKKKAEKEGFSISNMTAILKAYTSKYGTIFETQQRKAIAHDKGEGRTFDIIIDDLDALDETFKLYEEKKADGTLAGMKIVIDEHYDLQKIEILATGTTE